MLADQLTDGQVIELTQKCLDFYKANAKGKERTSGFIERIGIEELKKAVL